MPYPHSIRTTLCVFVLTLWLSTATNAQFRASIQGTVMDSQGAAVVGATVTLINKETNRTKQSTSSDQGFYRFDMLPPGQFMMIAEKTGFKKKLLETVSVNAEEAQGIDIQLVPGDIIETVTVSAELSEQLKTENANIDRSISEREVLRLPQYGRDPYELVRLAPGVFGLGARICCGLSLTLPNSFYPGGSNQSVFTDRNQPPISANGQRVIANSYEVDGMSVNSQVYGGTALVTPNQESVKEVRITTSSYSAENGGNTGALVQVVSQNGTNDIHGSAFFKYNDPTLNAYQQWGGPNGEAPRRDPRRYDQWGGSFGGPIYLPRFGQGGPALWSGKDKLFFFFSYETSRTRRTNSANYWTETPEYRQLLRQQRPNSIAATIVSAPGMEPRVQSIIPRTCAEVGLKDPANCKTLSGGLDIGSLTGTIGQSVSQMSGGGLDGIPDLHFAQVLFPNYSKAQQFNGRIDYQVTDNDLMAFSFYYTPVVGSVAWDLRPSYDENYARRNIAGVLLWSHRLSPTMFNEARFNISRLSDDDLSANPNMLWGIPHVWLNTFPFCCPNVSFGPYGPNVLFQTSYNFRDVLSKVAGNHGLRMGGDFSYELNDQTLGDGRPEYDGGSLWTFANDAPVFESGVFDPRTGVPTDGKKYYRTKLSALFVQESWKSRQNLTLTLGLRWEYFAPLEEKFGNLSNLVFGSGQNTLRDATLKIGGPLYKPDRNNFGPQVGFAWSPKTLFGSQTNNNLVLRGGFGITYSRIPQDVVDVSYNPPFWGGFSFLTGDQIRYSLGSSLTSDSGWPSHPSTIQQFDPVTNLPLNGGFLYATQEETPNPYTYLYSFNVQYGLPDNWVASLAYQGSASHKLPHTINPNLFFSSPLGGVALTATDGNSNFNAMLARLTHRFSKGFNFDAQYRWSKSIDTCSDQLACWIQTYPLDQQTERGPSDYDVTHYFVASGLWDVPMFSKRQDVVGKVMGGWMFGGILTASSGYPWTPVYNDRCASFIGRRASLCFLRPASYLGGLRQETSNEGFMRPGGTLGPNAPQYFTRPPSGSVTYLPPPGIGRNVFRGPHYFAVDMSLVKRIDLPKSNWLGDDGAIDLRANLFNIFNNLNLEPFFVGRENTVITSPDFGRAMQALGGRVVEFQVRLSF